MNDFNDFFDKHFHFVCLTPDGVVEDKAAKEAVKKIVKKQV